MSLVSRRDVVRTSGAVLSVPFLGGFAGRISSAQSPSPSTPTRNSYHSVGVYSEKIAQWTENELSARASAIYEGTATKADFVAVARATRLYAKHIQESGTDTYARKLARTIPPPTVTGEFSENTFQYLKGIIPSLQRSDVNTFTAHSPEGLAAAHASIASYGISPLFHTYADSMSSFANSMPGPSTIAGSAQTKSPGLGDEEYSGIRRAIFADNGRSPEFVQIQSSCQVIKAEICAVAESPAAQSAAAAAIMAALPTIAASANTVCGLILVGGAVLDIVTDGIGLSLTGLEVALCDAAELAAATAGIAVSTPFNLTALGAIVATAIDNVVKAACGA